MIDIPSLRQIPIFADLPDESLDWLAANGDEVRLAPEDILFKEGDPADYMFVFFEGELRGRRELEGGDSRIFTARAGEVTGMLPYSRLQTFGATGRALVPTRVARFHKNNFGEMLHRIPLLGERLISLMLDRVRETTKGDEQREKLMALGKMSAGLAHELNNPAGAAKRAAAGLREVREQLTAVHRRLDCRELTPKQRDLISKFESEALERSAKVSPVPSNSLDQSDREDELIEWMESHQVEDAWKLAPNLVEACIDSTQLEKLAADVGPEALGDALTRVSFVLLAAKLIQEIEQSTTRIVDLVKAIKEYTYMDQAPEQEIDIHDGIESTLTILAYKLRKKSIKVVREYDRSLPKICAFGVELNQVWTNLIVNAIEAMPEGGELRIRTWGEIKDLMVEVRDNGPGIPKDLQPSVFTPFFTTKGVGEGTGLGLDTVQRVARKHHGQVTLESQPGDTRFVVRLPKKEGKKA